MIQSLLQKLGSDPDSLLRALSARITDDHLQEIAQADYGCDAAQHLEALRQIRDHGTFPEPMHWFPGEVLELIGYSQPDDPNWTPGRTGERGHWMRAFATAALLRAYMPPWNYGRVEPSRDLVQLTLSLRALPLDVSREAAQFLSWVLLQSDLEGNDDQVLYFAIGVLWFSLHVADPPPDAQLIELCEWIVRREAELAAALPGGFERWLLGIRAAYPPPSPWERLGRELYRLDLSRHSTPLQDWVHLIGSQLAGESFNDPEPVP